MRSSGYVPTARYGDSVARKNAMLDDLQRAALIISCNPRQRTTAW